MKMLKKISRESPPANLALTKLIQMHRSSLSASVGVGTTEDHMTCSAVLTNVPAKGV